MEGNHDLIITATHPSGCVDFVKICTNSIGHEVWRSKLLEVKYTTTPRYGWIIQEKMHTRGEETTRGGIANDNYSDGRTKVMSLHAGDTCVLTVEGKEVHVIVRGIADKNIVFMPNEYAYTLGEMDHAIIAKSPADLVKLEIVKLEYDSRGHEIWRSEPLKKNKLTK